LDLGSDEMCLGRELWIIVIGNSESPNYGSYNPVPKELRRKMGELVRKGCNQTNQETSSYNTEMGKE